jgi:hypothetical protein
MEKADEHAVIRAKLNSGQPSRCERAASADSVDPFSSAVNTRGSARANAHTTDLEDRMEMEDSTNTPLPRARGFIERIKGDLGTFRLPYNCRPIEDKLRKDTIPYDIQCPRPR